MVLLRRSLQRVHFRGVEAILELRRQRQVRYAIFESGVLLQTLLTQTKRITEVRKLTFENATTGMYAVHT